VEAHALEMDESLLTGESDSVPKRTGDPVYSGSFCLTGAGLLRAEGIGAASYANRVTGIARAARDTLTPLQRNLNFVIQCLVALMVVIAALQMVGARNTGVDAVDALRFTLVIVTSFVPAGLVLAITVSLSAAAVRVGRHGTLVQRLSALESLGNLSVLCTDKTGTLTRNVLIVTRVEPLDGGGEAAVTARLADYAAGATTPNKTLRAIQAHVGAPATPRRVLAEVPFSSARKWSALTFGRGSVGRGTLEGSPSTPPHDESFVLGSPDTLLDPTDAAQAGVLARVEAMTAEGARVVVLALAPAGLGEAAAGTRPAPLVALALVAIQDEIRADIAQTIRALTEHGVDVKV